MPRITKYVLLFIWLLETAISTSCAFFLTNGARNVYESNMNVLEHILKREHGENAYAVEAIKGILHRLLAETKLHPMNLTGVY